MANITYEHLHHAVAKGEGWKKRYLAYKEKIQGRLEGATIKVVRTLEVGSAAAVGGLAQGLMKDPHVMHIPVDLGAGLILSILGYFNAAGSYSEHLNNFGDGFIAAYTSNLGFHLGDTHKTTGKWSFGGTATAELPAGGGAPAAVHGEISANQMAEIIRNVRQAAGA